MTNHPQIKICGLTDVEQAVKCAELGANAIGLVFYPRSPRNVSEAQARDISAELPENVRTVGVFVDESFSNIMRKAEHCNLGAVQLHGHETPAFVRQLRNEDIPVIKGLFTTRPPFLEDAPNFEASAFLAECGKGVLPGGNAMTWNWSDAKKFGEAYPLILAGGLSPENVAQAISETQPDAVDVSSGVEASPGQKNIAKAEAFIRAVCGCRMEKKARTIF